MLNLREEVQARDFDEAVDVLETLVEDYTVLTIIRQDDGSFIVSAINEPKVTETDYTPSPWFNLKYAFSD